MNSGETKTENIRMKNSDGQTVKLNTQNRYGGLRTLETFGYKSTNLNRTGEQWSNSKGTPQPLPKPA